MPNGFSTTPDVDTWPWFYLDNLLRTMLLDIPEIWGISLSGVHPITWPAKLLVIGLRLFLALGLIELAVQLIRSSYSGIRFQGTTETAFHRLQALPDGKFEIRRVAEISSQRVRGRWTQAEFTGLLEQD